MSERRRMRALVVGAQLCVAASAMAPSITFVTGNANKLKEVTRILSGDAPLPFGLQNKALDLPELQGEPEAIAREKCEMAAAAAGGPVMCEDTLLCFNALNGLPGPYIKWFLEKTGHAGLNNLLAAYDDKSASAPPASPVFFFSRRARRRRQVRAVPLRAERGAGRRGPALRRPDAGHGRPRARADRLWLGPRLCAGRGRRAHARPPANVLRRSSARPGHSTRQVRRDGQGREERDLAPRPRARPARSPENAFFFFLPVVGRTPPGRRLRAWLVANAATFEAECAACESAAAKRPRT